MKEIFLVKPNEVYKNSFKNYALAYKKINDDHYFNKYSSALENFHEYLRDLQNYSKGISLLEGDVTTSTFWLINNDEVVGVLRLRHEESDRAGHIGYDISPEHRKKGYGTVILRLALQKALEIGLKEVIVTCNINNLASKRIIEKTGGKLLGIIFDEEENEHLYKFCITL